MAEDEVNFGGHVVVRMEEVEATRPLEGEKWSQKNLVNQTLPREAVRPPGPNPCSNVPGGRGRCALAENEVNFGGHVVTDAPEPAFPEMNMVHFAAASKETNDTKKQESSS